VSANKKPGAPLVFNVVEDGPEKIPHTPCCECRYHIPSSIIGISDRCGYIADATAFSIRTKVNKNQAYCPMFRPEPEPLGLLRRFWRWLW
jgi:Zn ribbon nucleic-acid-binding protein